MTDIATLTVAEADCLAMCEQSIERGLKTFVEVGTSLATIRDNRLYRAEHATFEAYAATRWGFTGSRAYQLMDAAAVVSTIVEKDLPAPANEGQARELARVPEPERAEVWRETVERTDGKPTAAAIRAVHDERTQTPAHFTGPETEAAGTSTPAASVHNFPEPDEAADDARRDAELSAELANTATRFRANFSTTVARADDLWQFDVDRIVEVYAVDYDRAVRPFLEEMTRWIERVEQARRRQTSGLRLVNGGTR